MQAKVGGFAQLPKKPAQLQSDGLRLGRFLSRPGSTIVRRRPKLWDLAQFQEKSAQFQSDGLGLGRFEYIHHAAGTITVRCRPKLWDLFSSRRSQLSSSPMVCDSADLSRSTMQQEPLLSDAGQSRGICSVPEEISSIPVRWSASRHIFE